MIQGGT